MYAEENPLDFNKQLVDFELERLWNYLRVASQALDKQLKRAAREEATDEGLDDPSREKIHQAAFKLPPLLYASFIMMWYASVEQAFQRLCSDLKRQIEVGSDEKHTLKRGIDGAYKFLQKAQGYTVQAKHWDELKMIQTLRNVIVHKGIRLLGRYTKLPGECVVVDITDWEIESTQLYIPMKQDLYQYINQRNIGNLDRVLFKIAPTREYCEHLVQFARELFDTLFEGLSALSN
jgi:hypothetical protein